MKDYLTDSGKKDISELSDREVLDLAEDVEDLMRQELIHWEVNRGPKLN